ncbi:MAG: HEPN domain-containing protein [Candidatus Omnitrophica bacterium]|nr:HEPN domain-containing protein [Candidatus Omnitrophota bacterium]
MMPEATKLLVKAERSIDAAQALLNRADLDFAASRAYYAMFYVAEAVLSAKGLRFRKHTGVHAAFGEQFAKTGSFDPKFHRWLVDAFDQRIQGDYDVESAVTSERITALIQQAREFLQEAKTYLSSRH